MYDSLKRHFQQVLPFTEEELSAVDQYFTEHIFAKKAMLLEAPHPCKYLFFIVKGCVRHFHTKMMVMKKPAIFHLKTNGQPHL